MKYVIYKTIIKVYKSLYKYKLYAIFPKFFLITHYMKMLNFKFICTYLTQQRDNV